MGNILSWFSGLFTPIVDFFDHLGGFDKGYGDKNHNPLYNDGATEYMDPFDSLSNKYTEAGPTGKDLYIAQREDTSYQRSVSDMQAAGLNPALMYNSGASPVSVNSAQSGGSISDLLQLAMIPFNIQQSIAQTQNVKANTDFIKSNQAKVDEETQGITLDNVFKNDTLEARKEGIELSNNLKRSDINKINTELDQIVVNTRKLAEEAKTEESKRDLNFASALLDKVNAQVAVELLPYSLALSEAQTVAQKNYASLMAVQRLYQSKLISGGYIDAICDQMRASADSQEARTVVDKINSDIRAGKFGNDGSFLGKVGSSLLQGTVLALDQLKGIASIGLHFGKSLGKSEKKSDVNPGYNYDPFGFLSGE